MSPRSSIMSPGRSMPRRAMIPQRSIPRRAMSPEQGIEKRSMSPRNSPSRRSAHHDEFKCDIANLEKCTGVIDSVCHAKNDSLSHLKIKANDAIKGCRKKLIASQDTKLVDQLNSKDQMQYLRIITQFELWLIDRAVNVLEFDNERKLNEELALITTMCRNMNNQLEVMFDNFKKPSKGFNFFNRKLF